MENIGESIGQRKIAKFNRKRECRAVRKNLLGCVYTIFLLPVCTTVAQDFDYERRIEALEREVTQLRELTKSLNNQIQLLRAQIHQRPSSPSNVGATPAVNSGSWVIQVSSNESADTSGMQMKMEQSNMNLTALQSRLKQTEQSLDDARRQRSREGPSAVLRSQVRDKERESRRLKSEISKEKSTIKRMMREMDNARRTRTISGNTPDGEPVLITAKGSAALTAATLRVGGWYLVSGSGRSVGGVIQVGMKTANQTDAPND